MISRVNGDDRDDGDDDDNDKVDDSGNIKLRYAGVQCDAVQRVGYQQSNLALQLSVCLYPSSFYPSIAYNNRLYLMLHKIASLYQAIVRVGHE
jgi:hypothetical protein